MGVFSSFSSNLSWLVLDVKFFPSWFKTTTSQSDPKAKEKGSFFLPVSFYQEDNLSQKSLPGNFPRSFSQGPLTRTDHMALLKLRGGRDNKHWNFQSLQWEIGTSSSEWGTYPGERQGVGKQWCFPPRPRHQAGPLRWGWKFKLKGHTPDFEVTFTPALTPTLAPISLPEPLSPFNSIILKELIKRTNSFCFQDNLKSLYKKKNINKQTLKNVIPLEIITVST